MRKPRNILLNSKIAVGLGLIVLLALGLALIAQGFVDTRNYRDAIIEAIQTQTHRKVTIKGAVTVSLLPVPTLYIPGMELRDPNSDQPTPSASVGLISIRVTLRSAFEGKPKISAIVLERPALELVRAEDKLVHLDWLNPELFRALVASGDPDTALTIEINNGRVIYHDNNTDKTAALENVNALVANDSSLSARGGFVFNGHNMNFRLENTNTAANLTPFEFKMTSGDADFIEVKGNMDTSQALPELNGEMSLDLADATLWIKQMNLEGEQPGDVDAKRKMPLPVKIASHWSQKGLNVLMDNLHFEGLNSVGIGKMELGWKEWTPKIGVDMVFSSLDFDQWSNYVSSAFTKVHSNFYNKVYHGTDEVPENPLTQNLELSVNFLADKMKVGNQLWDNAKLSAVMADSAITVNQFGVELPGKSNLNLFGVITPSASNDLRFEGSMETKGKSLRDLLTVFDESASGLPETGFGDFNARSNIFISSEQLRLSDADVKLTELHLNGGLVAYFDSNVRLEADVKLKNINFDYFRDVWREKQKQDNNKDFFLKFDHSMNFNWLKRLLATIDFRVNVEHFTFLDHEGDNASFRVYAKSGDLGIYDINFAYPTDIMKGHFKLNVNGEQPLVELALSIGTLDTSYFSAQPYNHSPAKNALKFVPAVSTIRYTTDSDNMEFKTVSTAAAEEIILPPKPARGVDDLIETRKLKDAQIEPSATKRWSEELLDMSWMNGLSANIDLNVGRLLYRDLKFENLKLQTKFSNNLMVFNTLTFSYWGGQCSILGSLYGGKVPGFVISAALANIRIGDMLKDLTGRDNVYGNASINASLSSSGVNILSWVSQAEGRMVLVGRGVNVKGFNAPAVVDAVNVSRTASDVVNSVNSRLVDGSTTFSVDGNINIKNGMLRTPGIVLKSDAIVGNLVGEVKLINWTMDFSTLFQFPELSSETIPTLSVQLAGPLRSGEVRTDTSSLEAYVAKHIISK